MWFNDLMDYCKEGIRAVNNNKAVFIPIFINLAVNIFMGILLIITAVVFFGANIYKLRTIIDDIENYENIFRLILPAAIIIVALVILYLLIKALIDAGALNLYKTAANGEKLEARHFFEGMKNYFGRIFGGRVFLTFAFVILSLPIMIIMALYSVTVGVLTAGWGLIFAGVAVGVFLATWSIAIVVDNMGILEAIKTSFKFGKKNFWMLFTLLFANTLIGKYMLTAFGGLIAATLGGILSAMVVTYFNLILMVIYKSKSGQLGIKSQREYENFDTNL